jgi:chromosome segregation ATPase
VSAVALVKSFETGITTFLKAQEEKLQVQLRSRDAEIGKLRSEAKDMRAEIGRLRSESKDSRDNIKEFDKMRRESNVLKSQLKVERSRREMAENQIIQLENEKVSLESQLASRKRTWEDFKERMELDHGAVSSIVQRKRGTWKDGYRGDLMIVDGEEFERDIQRQDERSAGAGYQFLDRKGVRYTLVAAVSFSYSYNTQILTSN